MHCAPTCTYARGVLEVQMPNGTIKRIVRDRGFGFLRDEGGQDWFFIGAE